MANELSDASATPQPVQTTPPALPSPLADVQSGAVPAISLAPIEGRKTDALQEFVVKHFEDLGNAGIDYHEILQTNHSVLFNPAKISAAQLDEAAKAGKLFEVAPLARELGKPISVSAAESAPAAPATAPGAPLASAKVSAPVPSGLNTLRLQNVAPAPRNAPNPVPSQLGRRAV